MTCHSQIWANAEVLEPVRASFRTGKSLEWTRVHDLPDFAETISEVFCRPHEIRRIYGAGRMLS